MSQLILGFLRELIEREHVPSIGFAEHSHHGITPDMQVFVDCPALPARGRKLANLALDVWRILHHAIGIWLNQLTVAESALSTAILAAVRSAVTSAIVAEVVPAPAANSNADNFVMARPS